MPRRTSNYSPRQRKGIERKPISGAQRRRPQTGMSSDVGNNAQRGRNGGHAKRPRSG